jgi:uncharacterized protein (DUF2236 family)
MNVKDTDNLKGSEPRARERLTTAALVRSANAHDPEGAPDEASQEQQTARATPLFPPDVMDDFRLRWTEVQTGFVDEPRQAVERADELVAEAIKRLAESFSEERGRLESQWARGGDVSTEDLRLSLQRYRSFFERLLHL